MQRVAKDVAHFRLMTLWDDIDAIKLGFEQLLIERGGHIKTITSAHLVRQTDELNAQRSEAVI